MKIEATPLPTPPSFPNNKDELPKIKHELEEFLKKHYNLLVEYKEFFEFAIGEAWKDYSNNRTIDSLNRLADFRNGYAEIGEKISNSIEKRIKYLENNNNDY